MGASPYLGSIHTFGFNFTPQNYAMCNGALLNISQYTALFSLLGTQYGGNGQTTFGLPDLRGRVTVGSGALPGGQQYVQGQIGGAESVTLTTAQLPAHVHTFTSSGTLSTVNTAGTVRAPQANGFLARAIDGNPTGVALPQIYVPAGTNGTSVALAGVNVAGTTAPAGNSVPHENRPPFLVLNVCIAVNGIYPSRQ